MEVSDISAALSAVGFSVACYKRGNILTIDRGASALPGFAPEMRLFCFHGAGGNATGFRAWQPELPVWLELCPIQFPGRLGDRAQARCTSFPALIDTLAAQLADRLDRPYLLLGHSLGALVAFELARKLRSLGGRPPNLLVAMACRAPHLPSRSLAGASTSELLKTLQTLGGTPVEILENAELLELIVPIFRDDLQLVEGYTHRPEPPLEAPILALGGQSDPWIAPDQLDAWRSHTTVTRRVLLPGGHFFFQSGPRELIAEVIRSILPCHPPRGDDELIPRPISNGVPGPCDDAAAGIHKTAGKGAGSGA